jgi:hypothetical protein
MWDISEYGERCPSCPDFTIISDDDREWATARDMSAAMYAARHLALEERRKFRVLNPAGVTVGFVTPVKTEFMAPQ